MYQKIKEFCPHCCNVSPKKLVYQHSYECIAYDSDGEKSKEGVSCEYFVFVCETCDDILLYHDNEIGAEPVLFYPTDKGLDDSVPNEVASCYAEAIQIRTRAPNAYAVMIRKGLEAICDNRKIAAGPLVKRLKALAEKGEIPSNLIKVSDVLRELGNAAAHNGDLKVTIPITWGMDQFFRAIVEYVYVAPSKLDRFLKQLDRK